MAKDTGVARAVLIIFVIVLVMLFGFQLLLGVIPVLDFNNAWPQWITFIILIALWIPIIFYLASHHTIYFTAFMLGLLTAVVEAALFIYWLIAAAACFNGTTSWCPTNPNFSTGTAALLSQSFLCGFALVFAIIAGISAAMSSDLGEAWRERQQSKKHDV